MIFRHLPFCILAAVILGPACEVHAQGTLIPLGATWRYLDNGSDQGTTWKEPGFDDTAWASGKAQLGYGDGDEATVVSYGGNSSAKFITTYFRHAFQVADRSAVAALQLDILRDDGAVVYLNGTEVFRTNMPTGTVSYTTTASTAIDSNTLYSTAVDPVLLVDGDNVVAVEIHQANGTSSDISLDLRLEQTVPGLRRGPYLQKTSPSSATIRWRTDSATGSVVRYGTDPQNLDQTASGSSSADHVVTISGLNAATRYYYSIGDVSQTLVSGTDYFFKTHPVSGTASPARIWVLGDSGTADANARAVRDAFVNANGSAHADVVLMLGDNAYNNGTDSEYQAAVFDMYPEVLRNSPLWSTLGNHDGATPAVYYDIFTFPVSGESGGVSSSSEAYYSFDYANIHFVCLDSFATSRSSGGAMANWAVADLSATQQEWIIAFWHHPPYSKGSHNSDTETALIEMRQIFNKIFEDHGVDLVLCGHSHSYERSMLIDGHYGLSSEFSANPSAYTKDGGDGDPLGSHGGYVKEAINNDGAIYAVAGSSGKISGGALNHPVMIRNLNELGSMILDVNGNQLDAQFLNSAGAVTDRFRITHSSGSSNPPAKPTGLAVTTEGVTETEIPLTWVDNADNEDGYNVERSLNQVAWSIVASLPADSTRLTDAGLQASTEYFYRVYATSATEGNSQNSDIVSATTSAPASADYAAYGELRSFGTVIGDYTLTHEDDGAAEELVEVYSGGKASRRRNELEHTWQINIPTGAFATLFANAWSGGSGDGDDFLFAYSANGGPWQPAFTVSSTDSTNVEYRMLPQGTSGVVLVRVTDTNRTQGAAGLDRLFVDDLFIRVVNGDGDVPAAPTGLVAVADGYSQVNLSWVDASDDESGFQIERKAADASDWSLLATTADNVNSWNDTLVSPATTYNYRVLSFNGFGSSLPSGAAEATTDPAPQPSITLTARGYKVRKVMTVDLQWSGATGTNVIISRSNGSSVVTKTVANNGTYTDSTGMTGRGTFVYKVCEENNSAACSNEVTVVF